MNRGRQTSEDDQATRSAFAAFEQTLRRALTYWL